MLIIKHQDRFKMSISTSFDMCTFLYSLTKTFDSGHRVCG